jgi:pimeloyl-ACP methyl ester carboxylesterase
VLYLLPGLLCDEYVWRHQIAGLPGEIRVADFRGFDSLTAMAQSVLEQAPDRFAVAGHSMGGRAALEIMRLAPSRVSKLALLDTGVHPVKEGEAEKRQVLVNLAMRKGMTALAKQWLPPMVHPGRIGDAALMGPLVAMVERMTPEIYLGQIRALLSRRDAAPVLATIKCPTLVATGRQDGWSPVEQHEAMARAIPGAKLAVWEECGHMSTVEQPEAVTASLAEWLSDYVHR